MKRMGEDFWKNRHLKKCHTKLPQTCKWILTSKLQKKVISKLSETFLRYTTFSVISDVATYDLGDLKNVKKLKMDLFYLTIINPNWQ